MIQQHDDEQEPEQDIIIPLQGVSLTPCLQAYNLPSLYIDVDLEHSKKEPNDYNEEEEEEEEDLMPVSPILIANKYAILKPLGKGQFGSVYLGQKQQLGQKRNNHNQHKNKDNHDKSSTRRGLSPLRGLEAVRDKSSERRGLSPLRGLEAVRDKDNYVAMKLEAKNTPHPILKHESALLHYLYTKSCKHIPIVHWFGYAPELNANVLIQPYYPLELTHYFSSSSTIEDWLHRFVYPANRVLKQLHSLGVVHRDIKPSNWMFDANHQLVLIDFGLATFYESLVGGATIIGSPQYVSWFVHQGLPYAPRDDLLSLLYVILDVCLPDIASLTLRSLLRGEDRISSSSSSSSSSSQSILDIRHPQNVWLESRKHPQHLLHPPKWDQNNHVVRTLLAWATKLYSSQHRNGVHPDLYMHE